MQADSRHYAEGPEALIVNLASTGDRMAFAELVRRRQSWIRNLMRRCCGDSHLADDLSQQIFMQAWRKIKQLKDVNGFGPWLKKIAINEWLQYKRKKDALRGAGNDLDMEQSRKDETSLIMDLDQAISSLPGPVGLCIVLSYYARMSHTEIAEMTDLQIGTVKSHIRRGSEKLRELLSAYQAPAVVEELK